MDMNTAPPLASPPTTTLPARLAAMKTGEILKPAAGIEITLERWFGLGGPQGMYVVIFAGAITRFHHDIHTRARAVERTALFVEQTQQRFGLRASA